MKIINSSKKKIMLVSVATIVIVGAVAGSALINHPQNVGAEDSPLITQVDMQGRELANHEARITNTENDVKDIQTNTNTPASSNKVEVPSTTPSPTVSSQSQQAQTAEPTPIIVTAYREIVIDADTSDCEYTYSDGTSYQFHWKTTNPQGAWVTDGVGQNGHWQSVINTTGVCNKTSVGSLKI